MFGERIAEQRKKLGLSQEELAEKLNISQKSISKYELGDRKPQYKVLVRMAEYFGVTTDYLLGAEEGGNTMLGKRINELRRASGMTQEELAEALNISRSTLAGYEAENKKPSFDVTLRIAKHFGVTTDYLLGVDGGEKDMKNRVKELREENGMKQSELGKLLNVQDAAISKYESGDIPLTGEKIIQLAEYFGVSTDYLLGLEDIMETNEKSNEIVHRTGQNIKNLRERKGLTQQELAVRVDVAQATVANWESGRREPDINILIRIAKLFNVTLDELVMKELTPPIPMYARNLAYLRRKHGMTQADVANLLGVSKATSCKYENGDVEPNVEQLIKLADFFGVTMDQIIKQDLSQEVSEWKQ